MMLVKPAKMYRHDGFDDTFFIYPEDTGFMVLATPSCECLNIDLVWGSYYNFVTEEMAFTALRQALERQLLSAKLREDLQHDHD